MGHAKLASLSLAVRVDTDADDLSRAGEPSSLNEVEADAA